jgi:prophage DNA circulation protein
MKEICKVGDFIFAISPQREVLVDDGRELAKVDIPGASAKYQDMGRSEKTISWSGVLTGDGEFGAFAQASAIQTEMHKGTVLPFSYGKLKTTVRIKSFKRRVRRFDLIYYDIELVEEIRPVQTAAVSATQKRVLGSTSSNNAKKSTSNTKSTQKSRTVKIKQGQTLSELAKIYYGDSRQWQKIAKANGIKNPRKIPAGKSLIIP